MSKEPTETGASDQIQDDPEKRPWFDPVRLGLLGIIVIIVVLLLGFSLPRIFGSDEPAAAAGVQVIDPPLAMDDFTLTDSDGQPVSLSDFRGEPVLLFFGYTHCPDVCPTTLANFRQIKRELGEDGDNVTYVFISVDGSRDTPEVVGQYVSTFDPSFIGLTGDEEKVRAIGVAYSVFFQHSETESESAAGYLIDHTAMTYLLDADGNLRTIYSFNADRSAILDGVKDMVN